MKSRFEIEAKVMVMRYLGFPLLTSLITVRVLQVVGAPRSSETALQRSATAP